MALGLDSSTYVSVLTWLDEHCFPGSFSQNMCCERGDMRDNVFGNPWCWSGSPNFEDCCAPDVARVHHFMKRTNNNLAPIIPDRRIWTSFWAKKQDAQGITERLLSMYWDAPWWHGSQGGREPADFTTCSERCLRVLRECDTFPEGFGGSSVLALARMRQYRAVNISLSSSRNVVRALLRCKEDRRSSWQCSSGMEQFIDGFRDGLFSIDLPDTNVVRTVPFRHWGLVDVLRNHFQRVIAALRSVHIVQNYMRVAFQIAYSTQLLLVFLVDAIVAGMVHSNFFRGAPLPNLRFDTSACCSRATVLLALIRKMARERGSKERLRVAEIGLGWGATTRKVLGQLRRDGILVDWLGIDPFFPATAAQARAAPLPDWAARARDATIETYASLDATLLRLTADDSAAKFDDGTFDLVFVDAQHDGTDLLAWEKKVAKGGTLMGHDFSPDWSAIPYTVFSLRCEDSRFINGTLCGDVWLGADFTFWWHV